MTTLTAKLETATPATTRIVTCADCMIVETEAEARIDGSAKIPRGWKLISGDMVCPDCAKQWITRAVTWSIDRVDGMTWTTFVTECNREFSTCARMANRMMQRMFAGDPGVDETTGKLGKLPSGLANEIYHLGREAYPELPSTAVSGVSQRVYKRWMADRFDIFIAHKKSVPSFKLLPLEVRRSNWHPGWIQGDERREFAIVLPLGELRGKDRPTLVVRLKTRSDWMLAENIMSGEIDRRTLELLPGRVGQRGMVKLKIVYRMKSKPGQARKGMLRLRFGDDCFVSLADRRWHHPGYRGCLLAYERWMLAQGEDRKHERRWPKARRIQMNRAYKMRAEKMLNRTRSFIQQRIAEIVGLVRRQRKAGVEYDKSTGTYLPSFPYADFALKLANTLKKEGLNYTVIEPENDA